MFFSSYKPYFSDKFCIPSIYNFVEFTILMIFKTIDNLYHQLWLKGSIAYCIALQKYNYWRINIKKTMQLLINIDLGQQSTMLPRSSGSHLRVLCKSCLTHCSNRTPQQCFHSPCNTLIFLLKWCIWEVHVDLAAIEIQTNEYLCCFEFPLLYLCFVSCNLI